MRVLHYTLTFTDTDIGGQEVLVRVLSEKQTCDSDVAVYTWMKGNLPATEMLGSVKLIREGPGALGQKNQLVKAVKRLVQVRTDFLFLRDALKHCDIFHVHGPTFGWRFPSQNQYILSYDPVRKALQKCKHAKSLVTFHRDFLPKEKPSFINEAMTHDAATSVSSTMAQALRIRHLPNGVDTKMFKPHEYVNDGSDKVHVLCPTRITPWKRQLEFVGLVEPLKDRIRIRFTGNFDPQDAYCRAVQRRVEAVGLDATFTGSLEFSQLPQMYAWADLVALPSKGPEGMPLTALEASSSSRAVVAYDVAGTPDIIHAGVNGFLAKTDEEFQAYLTRLVEDKQLRSEMGRKGREIALPFDWNEIASAYNEIYTELLSS